MSSMRTRIAPSPTGALHVGTARTALFNYLFAKKHGGVFVLRIEDTDLERSDQKYEKDILDSLKWLGIAYDEGPDVGGAFAPYRQSERIETYKKHLEELLANKDAFYCFHSEAELEAEREELLTDKKPPIHLCEYRDLAGAEVKKLLKEKPERIIRFRTPSGRKINFDDLIRGQITFESDLLGDFSLAKVVDMPLEHSPASRANVRATHTTKPYEFSPLYNFAVVVDDFEMQISHVIRGEDHISNTPKQILVQESLGFPRPVFAHLPLILGPDRSKLSKRHGATSIVEYREAGYLPEALVNFMALLGWNPAPEQSSVRGKSRKEIEVFSKNELIELFSLEKVQKSGAVFNLEKLDWMNGEYIRRRPVEDLEKIVREYNFLPGFSVSDVDATIRLEQPRLRKISDIRESKYVAVEPKHDIESIRWKSMSDDEIKESLAKSRAIIESITDTEFSAEKLKERFFKEIGAGDKGNLLWPLRVVFTGKKASPGPFEIMGEFGKEKSLKRLENAIEKLAPLQNLH